MKVCMKVHPGTRDHLSTRACVGTDCEFCEKNWPTEIMGGKKVHYRFESKVEELTNYVPTIKFHRA